MTMQEAQFSARLIDCLERQAAAAYLAAAEGVPTRRAQRAAQADEAHILAECRQTLGGKRAAHIHAEAIARVYARA